MLWKGNGGADEISKANYRLKSINNENFNRKQRTMRKNRKNRICNSVILNNKFHRNIFHKVTVA